ncbi:hypothetical protein SR882_04605 [Guyparkeria halophila]|uniref:Cxxc_20_cxxc protein n=1 Tax=Guyparkeria halophila TaxID=47960 RepID=A0ABZ0YYE6_9GAMM|nr:hypothetical protein [Guyparkeria halophila]WQH17189.1 hypothetical protein SR882_04605 [Guyparkeria halophila]
MKCPHCDGSFSLFSREMNRFGREAKRCPYCQGSVRLFVSLKVAALLFVPAVALAIVLEPVMAGFGIGGSVTTGMVCGLLAWLSLRLKPAPLRTDG